MTFRHRHTWSTPGAVEKMRFCKKREMVLKNTLFKQGWQDVGNCWTIVMDTWMFVTFFSKTCQMFNMFSVFRN